MKHNKLKVLQCFSIIFLSTPVLMMSVISQIYLLCLPYFCNPPNSVLPIFFTLIDSGLEPFTSYEYRVRGWNGFGQCTSHITTVTTSEDKPWGVAPPRWQRLGERDDIIQLQWQAPARPNGLYLSLCATSS